MRNSDPGSPVSSIDGRLPAADAGAPITRLFESMRPDLLRFAHWLGPRRAGGGGGARGGAHGGGLGEDIVREPLRRAGRSGDALKDRSAARPWLLPIAGREHARLYERKR